MSALLSADDLNDFISPGIACIKPVEIKPVPTRVEHDSNPGQANDEMEVEISIDGTPYEVSKDDDTKGRPLEQAQISLSDCLACSGCITSAEEVLVAQHSHKELINAIKENTRNKKFVASISHQTRASLAGAYSLSIEEADKFLIDLFINRLGFSSIVGMGLGRKISLQQSSKDLIARKSSPNTAGQFPVLSSACPGFILYAEKTHPQLISRISNIKSPQQITGQILKKMICLQYEYNILEEDVYHLSVMPCFDKKLEAARPEKDFETDEVIEESYKDVDCVITAKELIQLLIDEKFDIDSMIDCVKADHTPVKDLYMKFAPKNWPYPVESWLNDEGSASGGYSLQYLLNYREVLSSTGVVSLEKSAISQVCGRNSDIIEYRLVNIETGEKLASTAIVNGFRNIQNIVRKLKSGNSSKKTKNLVVRRKARANNSEALVASTALKEEVADASTCDYVEVMACPNGCINGGGQISAPENVNVKQWISSIEELYYSIPVSVIGMDIDQWIEGFCNNFKVQQARMLMVRYSDRQQSAEEQNIPAALAIGSKW